MIPGMADWRAIARGGFAIVWQARQESLNRLVAVKVDERKLDTEAEQRRFLREAGAAGRMSGHPGIVTVHDAGLLGDDRPFLIMELCPGGSLTRWMTADPRPSQRRVRDVGVRIADALSAAHLLGVLHRDVKPANILIDAYNNAGLADFGLAALIDPDTPLSETVEAITPGVRAAGGLRQEAAHRACRRLFPRCHAVRRTQRSRPALVGDHRDAQHSRDHQAAEGSGQAHPRSRQGLHGCAARRHGRGSGEPPNGRAISRSANGAQSVDQVGATAAGDHAGITSLTASRR